MIDIDSSLNKFSEWVLTCSGSEIEEGRTYFELLLQAWGWKNTLEASAKFEKPIKKASPKRKTGRSDYLIPKKVLWEMKSRGENLNEHYPQLQRYWFNLTPKTKYAVLCNFDNIWIYDFNKQVDEPVDKIHITELSKRKACFSFMGKEELEPIFGNDKTEITENQARSMGTLFKKLKRISSERGDFTETEAQRFILQCVYCMFAEDRGLLENKEFSRALNFCRESGESTFDILGGLFNEMNRPGITSGGRYKGTKYFNGGLFNEIQNIHLPEDCLQILIESSKEDWNNIRPSIFGNIFEASSRIEERHKFGQYFTSEVDILKVVRPTIIEPFEERIDEAKNISDLENLLHELRQITICDPACGSGNFLYVAYNSLKDLEVNIIRKIKNRRKNEYLKDQFEIGYLTTKQFYGIDQNPLAVELAKVTLSIATKVAHDRLGLTERELPLDNLDKNITQCDALFDDLPNCDFYIGNPPFLGAKRLRQELGDEYTERLFRHYPEAPNFADICCYWFRNVHEKLKVGRRAGLVGTNMIRRGNNRKASLDFITNNGGTIFNAISTQVWSGEANVHVSIVNWIKGDIEKKILDGQKVSNINTTLLALKTTKNTIKLNANKGFCYQGCIPLGKGFDISEEEAKEWIRIDPKNEQVIKPFSMGKNLSTNILCKPDRWIIDFNDMSLEEAEEFELPFKQVTEKVKPFRLSKSSKEVHKRWWVFHRYRPLMREAIKKLDFYIGVPRVSKWCIFVPIQKAWLPGEKNVVVASDDFFTLGILNSSVHRAWVESQKATIKADTAYTHETCFQTFPFPQTKNHNDLNSIRSAMKELSTFRNQIMISKKIGITEMYNRYFNESQSKLFLLHKELDKVVYESYGFKKNENLIDSLISLNKKLSNDEQKGIEILGPVN